MRNVNVPLPDEVFERVSQLAENLDNEVSAYIAAVVADATAGSEPPTLPTPAR